MRGGELIIGNATNPFTGNLKIILYGDPLKRQMVFENSFAPGNKLISNTGLIQMYGKPRKQMSRLQQQANPGDQYIIVELGLDWAYGDRIGLAPTNMR